MELDENDLVAQAQTVMAYLSACQGGLDEVAEDILDEVQDRADQGRVFATILGTVTSDLLRAVANRDDITPQELLVEISQHWAAKG